MIDIFWRALNYQEIITKRGIHGRLRGIPKGHGNMVQRCLRYEKKGKVPMSLERLHSGKRRKT